MKLKINAEIVITGIMFIAFFLPWVDFGLGSISGYTFGVHGKELRQSYSFLIFFIPLLIILIYILNALGRSTRNYSLAIGIGTVGLFIFYAIKFGKDFFAIMAGGLVLSMLCAIALIVFAGILPQIEKNKAEAASGGSSTPAAALKSAFASLRRVFTTHKKPILVGVTSIVLLVGIYFGGRAIYRATRHEKIVKAGGDVLTMRQTPDVRGKFIYSIPDRTVVKVLEETGDEISLGGAKGKWTRVVTGGHEGWVFGGFLADTNDSQAVKPAMDASRIDL
ncbi:MAG: SH3 domain-containing protein [Spirochaetes bacterium]|nr:SH3 domain-containing protein [Spirochaetota bacterium]